MAFDHGCSSPRESFHHGCVRFSSGARDPLCVWHRQIIRRDFTFDGSQRSWQQCEPKRRKQTSNISLPSQACWKTITLAGKYGRGEWFVHFFFLVYLFDSVLTLSHYERRFQVADVIEDSAALSRQRGHNVQAWNPLTAHVSYTWLSIQFSLETCKEPVHQKYDLALGRCLMGRGTLGQWYATDVCNKHLTKKISHNQT